MQADSELWDHMRVCYEAGDLKGALDACRRLLEVRGQSAELLSDMGALSFQLGRPKEAIRLLTRALKLDPAHAEANENLRLVCRAMGTTAEAALRQPNGEALTTGPAAGVDVSVVVPAHSHFEVLDKCLDALHVQTLPAERFEVLVVGNGLTEGTAAELDETMRRWSPHFGGRLRLLGVEPASIARARNEGIRQAAGDVILQINLDTVLSRTALAQHYEQHEAFGFEPECVVVGGRRFGRAYLRSLFNYLHEAIPLYTALHRPRPRFLGDHTWFVTCNLSAMKEAYASFGLYDPAHAWGSDQALGKLWEQEHGARIYVDTNIVGYHPHWISFDSWKAKCIEGAPYWFRRNMGMVMEEMPPAGRRAVREELDSMGLDPAAAEADLRRLERNFNGPDAYAGDVVMGQPALTLGELVYRLRPLLRDYRKWLQYSEIWQRIVEMHGEAAAGPQGEHGLTRRAAALADLDLA